jgi:hypothetical protein
MWGQNVAATDFAALVAVAKVLHPGDLIVLMNCVNQRA